MPELSLADRLKKLADSSDEELLREVTLDILETGRGAVWEKVCERIIDLTRQHAREPRLRRDDLFALVDEKTPPGNRTGFTQSMFRKNYNNISWLGVDRTRRLVCRLFEEEHVARAASRFAKDPNVRERDRDLPLYEVLRKRARADNELVEYMARAAEGTYQFWRHATTIPDRYVKGIMNIRFTYPDYVTYVTVDQRYAEVRSKAPIVHGVADRRERFKGYVIPLSRNQCILIGRGVTVVGFRIIIFTDLAPVPLPVWESGTVQQIFSMFGCTMGTADSRGFFSPVYVERLDSKDIEDHRAEINIYNAAEIPDKIVALLSRTNPTIF